MEEIKRKNFNITLWGAVGLIGCACIIYTVTNISVYFTTRSHFAKGGKNINIQWSVILPILFSCVIFIMYPIVPLLQKRFGNFKLLILGSALWLIGVLLLISSNIFATLFALIVAGAGYVFLYSIPMKNACLYYKKKRGFIISCFEGCCSLFEFIFNLVGELIINPHKAKILEKGEYHEGYEKEDWGIYEREIGENVWKFVVLLGVTWAVGTAIGLLTFREYKPEYEEKQEIQQEMGVRESNPDQEEEKVSTPINSEGEDVLAHKEIREIAESAALNEQEIYRNSILKAAKSKRLWLIMFIAFGSQLPHAINSSTMRTVGAILQKKKSQQELVSWLPNIKLIFYFVSSIIFGQTLDKFGYKRTLLGFTTISIIGGLLLVFFLQVDPIFDIAAVVTGIINGGTIVIFSYHMFEVFGAKYFLEINGILNIVVGFACMIVCSIAFTFAFYIESEEEAIAWPYRGLYIASTVITIIAFYLQFEDSSEEFEYDEPDEDRQRAHLTS